MRYIAFCMLTLLTVAGCSKPEPVAQLDMSNYWYTASSTVTDGQHCLTSMTVSGGSKVKCE